MKNLLALAMIVNINLSVAQFEMKKHSINSGGGASTGGNFSLNASIGQVDASDKLTGGVYSLNGGLWHQIQPSNTEELIFNNGFE